MNQKVQYLLRSMRHYFDSVKCPYCSSSDYQTIKRKYIVTELVECNKCKLRYRIPIDPTDFNDQFYQESYSESNGFITQLPDENQLKTLINSDFKITAKGINLAINVFHTLFSETKGLTVLDYGANWGYVSYLMLQQGLNVQSFEISKPRASYGNQKLGLDIKTSIDDIKPINRVFFSSHVIEHVPSIQAMLEHARLLTLNQNDVYFISFCPNGSLARLKKDPKGYHKNWGLVHPNLLSDLFYQKAFSCHPYFIDSYPYDLLALQNWDKESQFIGQMEGQELLIIARIKKDI